MRDSLFVTGLGLVWLLAGCTGGPNDDRDPNVGDADTDSDADSDADADSDIDALLEIELPTGVGGASIEVDGQPVTTCAAEATSCTYAVSELGTYEVTVECASKRLTTKFPEVTGPGTIPVTWATGGCADGGWDPGPDGYCESWTYGEVSPEISGTYRVEEWDENVDLSIGEADLDGDGVNELVLNWWSENYPLSVTADGNVFGSSTNDNGTAWTSAWVSSDLETAYFYSEFVGGNTEELNLQKR